jgi:predicted oxidoreductase (fatty acid repression mutant protein)
MKDKTTNILIIDGGTVKTDESGTVEGLGIVFGSEEEPDSSKERDFFTKESFIRKKEQFIVPLYYNHGLGPIKTEVGEATLTKEENGWRATAQIDIADEIGKAVYDIVKEKPHGFSTGALQHLVRREAKSNGTNFLKQWVVGEISLTERPAERKAVVESIKSADGEIIATTDAWVEEVKEAIPPVIPTEDSKLIPVFNEKGEKVWDLDEDTFKKVVEVAGDAKCGGYSYINVNEESASITVSEFCW